MKKLSMILTAGFLSFAGFVYAGDQYLINIEVPAAGSSVSITNNYGKVINIVSGLSGFSGVTPVANNVVGKVTRTAGSTTADLAVFASGTTTNVSTSFKVNDALAIDPGEIVVITNLAASATVLSLTIEPTK